MIQILMTICQTMCGAEIPCLDGNLKPLMHVLDHWFSAFPS